MKQLIEKANLTDKVTLYPEGNVQLWTRAKNWNIIIENMTNISYDNKNNMSYNLTTYTIDSKFNVTEKTKWFKKK